MNFWLSEPLKAVRTTFACSRRLGDLVAKARTMRLLEQECNLGHSVQEDLMYLK